jgi:hypothetical protein
MVSAVEPGGFLASVRGDDPARDFVDRCRVGLDFFPVGRHAMTVHILRRAFHMASVDELIELQKQRIEAEHAVGRPRRLYQRMRSTPTRQTEILDDGSIYWVIKGYVRARQRILEIETRMDSEGRKRCFLRLDPKLIPTVLSPSKPRRGWRYLAVEEAPLDRTKAANGDGEELPHEMAAELHELGLL